MAQLKSLSIAGNPVVNYVIEEGTVIKSVTHGATAHETVWNYRKYNNNYIEMWTCAKLNTEINIAGQRDDDWVAELPYSIIYGNDTRLEVNMVSNTTPLWCGHIFLKNAQGNLSFSGNGNYVSWSSYNFQTSGTTKAENGVGWNIFVSGTLT